MFGPRANASAFTAFGAGQYGLGSAEVGVVGADRNCPTVDEVAVRIGEGVVEVHDRQV